MDSFSIHLAPLPRRMPAGLPVASIGYQPQKATWMRCRFETFNFSFILSGGGSFTFRGKTHAVEAPCVFTQWPGEPVEYGPGGRRETWEELYLIYPAERLGVLTERKLALLRKPIWPVRQAAPMRAQLRHLLRMLEDPNADGMPDRIDRTCEMLVVESRLGEHRPPLGRDESVIREIRDHVRTHSRDHHDFDALAREHGLSPSNFRRYWARYVHTPPAHYGMNLLMREACRLLVETDDTVTEIADALGFSDPLYFSRRFSKLIGMPATEYRRHNALQV